jgi:hypothetical protein
MLIDDPSRWVGDILEWSGVVGGFLQGFLPVMVANIFSAFLLLIIRHIAKQEGVSRSSLGIA